MSWVPGSKESLDDEPFLQPEDQERIETSPKPLRRCIPSRTAIIFHFGLISLYTALFFVIARYHTGYPSGYPSRTSPPLTWSPADEAITWEARAVDGLRNDSVYAGRPSPEVDNAWHDLLQNINLRIHSHEMAKLDHQSLAFADGSGYLGTIGVYHELHCLKRLRKWMYRDTYYPNMTAEEEAEHYTHADHCLELLRQASICKGDTSVTPFKWLHSGNGPDGVEPTTQEGIMHQCVEWEPLERWASERRVDLFDRGLLARPE